MLFTLALLLSPAAFHQLAESGGDSLRLHGFATRVMEVTLLPFALGLGANVYIPADAINGDATGLGFGLSAAVLGCLLWYGPGVLRGTREGQPTGGNSMRQLKKDEGTGHCAAGKLIGCDLQPRIWLKPWNANGRNTRTPKREFNTRACSVRSWRQRGHWKLALEPREL